MLVDVCEFHEVWWACIVGMVKYACYQVVDMCVDMIRHARFFAPCQ